MRSDTDTATERTDSDTSAVHSELLGRYAQGDDSAFERLVELVGGRLFGFICRMIRNPHTAEDVYQSVLVKVATHADSFDGRAKFNTWLYRIARNACLDEIRKMARNREHASSGTGEESDSVFDQVAHDGPQPGEAVSQVELGRRIQQAVEDLPDEQREVFLLKEDGGLTFEDIGEMLGCGKETAKSRMRYALKRLQNALGQEARLYGLSGTEQ